VVFTGGYALWESKRLQHPNAHPFPSSVDVAHFATARTPLPEPEDMKGIPHPRIGFYGVVDERMDLDLLQTVAQAHPEWHLVILGPVVKVAEEDLPRGENIHYLGGKKYKQLPAYLAHWDVAMLPFARNDSTEFISPTKTPEYLAAGRPVVSTAIRDVVRPYGDRDLVLIGRTPEEFIAGIEESLREPRARQANADAFVGRMSWDRTWRQMKAVITETVAGRLPSPSGRAARPASRSERAAAINAVQAMTGEADSSATGAES
ncbi:MAG TPA: glycosyltransferase, partial [Deinococcales bacterium]|nr:glycosyltransferase [Deinococcales bacterium]